MNNADTERVVAPPNVEYEELATVSGSQIVVYPNEKNYQSDVEFAAVIHETELAVQYGILPQLSRKGSSGCYFVHNRESVSMEVWSASVLAGMEINFPYFCCTH